MKRTRVMKFKKIVSIGLIFSVAMVSVGCGKGSGSMDMKAKENKTMLVAKAEAETVGEHGLNQAYAELGKLKKTEGAIQSFSWNLFKKMGEEENLGEQNVMISPISILMALGMVENGADGTTLAELEQTFGCPVTQMSQWLKNWEKVQTEHKDTRLHTANSLWFKNEKSNWTVEKPFIDRITNLYGAELYMSAFDRNTLNEMNQWVQDKTNGKIKKLIEKFQEETIAVLLNAVDFTGAWEKPYESSSIIKDQFFTREDGTVDKVTMLESVEDEYFSDDKMIGFTKPYKEGYTFFALLPNEEVSLSDYLSELDSKKMAKLLNDGKKYGEVIVTMPEFQSEYKSEETLMDALKSLGLKKIFDRHKSDLSKLATSQVENERLFVSKVVHKTFIQVNRKGTEAAAATSVVIDECRAIPPETEPVEITLDRPFVYGIVDNVTYTPVFLGSVAKIER